MASRSRAPQATSLLTAVALVASALLAVAGASAPARAATPLTVTVDQAPAQADPTRVASTAWVIAFSEPVSGVEVRDLVVDGTADARPSGLSSSDGGVTWTVTLTPTAVGTIILSLPAATVVRNSDGAPNEASTSTDNTVTYDPDGPTVSITRATDQPDPTLDPVARLRVVFSEPVTGFDSSDLILGGTAPGPRSATVTGAGPGYDVVVTGATSSGTLTAAVRADAATDAVGNPSLGSETFAVVTYAAQPVLGPGDLTAPTLTCRAAFVGTTSPGRLARVRVAVTADDAGGLREVRLVSVTSSQRQRGLRPTDRPRDIVGWRVGADDRTGRVRVERIRRDRTYTWTYRATDVAGNTTSCTTRVRISR